MEDRKRLPSDQKYLCDRSGFWQSIVYVCHQINHFLPIVNGKEGSEVAVLNCGCYTEG